MIDFDKLIKERWNTNIRERKMLIGGLVVGMIIIIVILVVSFIFSNSINKLEDTFNRELSGELKELTNYKGDTWVKLHKDSASYVLINSYNYQLKQPQLYKFINVGDSIYKPVNTDSLFIFRNKEEYLFILGDLTFNKY